MKTGNNFCLVLDNARIYNCNKAMQYYNRLNVSTLFISVRAPKLNVIEIF